MSWLSSIISGSPDGMNNGKQLQARQRASTRARLVKNLRSAAQALAALQARQEQQSASKQAGGALGVVEDEAGGGSPLLIGGDTPEAGAVCLALEQCLFHRIRVKEFGVVPFWAFLERVERVPMTTGEAGGRPGLRERRLASVRNTVGAVASLGKVSTPLGRARAWIRQCLVCKCLEACVAALLDEERLVKVFYEPTALARCREGSTILLRLCAALEAFDVAIDADRQDLDHTPRWPILEEEAEWDRRAEAAAAASAAAAATGAWRATTMAPSVTAAGSSSLAQHSSSSFSQSGAAESTERGGVSSRAEPAPASATREEDFGSLSWFQQQRKRQQQEAAEGRSDAAGWAASALSELDQLAKGDWNEQLDGVLATVSSKVDKAVQSLDETINEMFGEPADANTPWRGSTSDTRDGWVELRGGVQTPASALLDQGAAGTNASTAAAIGNNRHLRSRSDGTSVSAAANAAAAAAAAAASAGAGGYPGSFLMGKGARAGSGKGRSRMFGVPLEELVLDPGRCQRGRLDPALGVPDAFLSLIEALSESECRNTPDLFSRNASESDLIKVVKSLDKTNRVPRRGSSGGPLASPAPSSSPAWLVARLTGGGADDSDRGSGANAGGSSKGGLSASPLALASALVYFLHRLPEPLLTFRRREAFLACETIPDLDARVRNVKILVDDLPWAHQPCLLALAGLFREVSSGSAARSPSRNAAPGLSLRSTVRHNPPGGSVSDSDPKYLTEGVTVVDETDFGAEVGDEDKVGRGSTIRVVAESLAPALLRYPPGTAGGEGRDDAGSGEQPRRLNWEEELAATAVVELILSEQTRVLEGVRTEQELREKRLSRKVERLGQLHKMLATSVYLERPAHKAIVISIWRRLEAVEQEFLVEAAEESKEAPGFAPKASVHHDRSPAGQGQGLGEKKTSPLEKGAGTVGRAPAIDDADRDVLELENMLMGIETEELLGKAPTASLMATTSAEKSADAGDAGAALAGGGVANVEVANVEVASTPMTGSVKSSPVERKVGEDAAAAWETIPGPPNTDGHSPLAFTIEEDGDDEKVQPSTLTASHGSRSESPSTSAAKAVADNESTRELLGSIAATLTPSSPGGGNGDANPSLEGQMSATRSELALVDLMDQAEEEPGRFSAAGAVELLGGKHSPDRLGGKSITHPGNSEFGAVHSSKSTGFESADDAAMLGYGSTGRGGAGKASVTSKAPAPAPVIGSGGANRHFPGDRCNEEDVGHAPSEDASTSSRAAPVFSLDHDRWITCGFLSTLTIGRGKPGEASVGRALRDASNVLALDSMNYFLARYPRSAARAVKSSARRQHICSGGEQCYSFPARAGDITRVIASLISLEAPPSSGAAGVEGEKTATATTPRVDGVENAESEGDRALRLATHPAWRLLDAPNAFQEAFVCAVLVMEAAQTAGKPSPRPINYEESLLEVRRVLHACIMHAPSNVEAFWAAAAVEGSVSPDPEDFASPGTCGESSEPRRMALPEELVRVLGLAELNLRDEDLPLLEELPAGGRSRTTFLSDRASSMDAISVDDRVGSRGGLLLSSSSWKESSPKFDGEPDPAAASSDWLMAGETARTGMIDSISMENGGQSGAKLVDDGVFQTRMLCSSQILSGADARLLQRHLPATVASSDWAILFSDERHGSSLKTLLARCAGWQPTLVLIKACILSTASVGRSNGDPSIAQDAGVGGADDAEVALASGDPKINSRQHATVVGGTGKGSPCSSQTKGGTLERAAPVATPVTLGGFASGSEWKNMGRAFAGDGGSFLFNFHRNPRTVSRSAGEGGWGSDGLAVDESGLHVYPWAHTNRCFMTSDDRVGLGMGAGSDGGNFGFLLSPDLRSGTTGRCETFRNRPLVVEAELSDIKEEEGFVFDVLSLEVWGFQATKPLQSFTRIAL